MNKTTPISAGLATAASIATLAAALVSPSAMAAGNTGIDVIATPNTTLEGHRFSAVPVGTYDNVVTANGQATSYQINGTDASNAWVKAAVDAYNAAQKDDTKDIKYPVAQDPVAALAGLDQPTLRNVVARMAEADDKPAAATTQAGTGETVHLDVPDGLYLIIDEGAGGVPMLVSTKIGGLDFNGTKLGSVTIKSKAVTLDKKLVQGSQLVGSGSLSVGSTAQWRMTLTLPVSNDGTTTSVKVVDHPNGMKFTGDKKDITVKVGDTDVTSQVGVYLGGEQVPANAGIQGDVARDVPQDGFGLSLDDLLAQYGGKQVVIEAKTEVTSTADGNHPQAATAYVSYFDGNTPVTPPPTPPTSGECVEAANTSCVTVPVKSYGFDLNKTSQADDTVKVSGAGFKIQNADGKWLKLDAKTGAWSEAADEADATEFLTGDTDHDGTVSDAEAKADTAGRIRFDGLGAGEYTVKETKAPAGYLQNAAAMPSFKATITADGKITFAGVDLPNQTVDGGNGSVTVKDLTNLTQLPFTGGSWSIGSALGGAVVFMVLAGGIYVAFRKVKADASKPIDAMATA